MNNKEQNFDLSVIWKECAKEYNLKKKDYLLYTVNGNLIFSIFSKLVIKAEEYYLDVVCDFKPLWADDLYWSIQPKFWDFTKEPMSFRVIGSDTAPMKNIYQNQVKLGQLNMTKTKEIFCNEIEHILSVIKTTSEDEYKSNNELSVIDILVEIHNKDYKKAQKKLRKWHSPYTIKGELKKDGINPQVFLFKKDALKYIRGIRIKNLLKNN